MSTQKQPSPSASPDSQTTGEMPGSQEKVSPALAASPAAAPISEAGIEDIFQKLVSEKVAKGLPRNHAVTSAKAQIQRDGGSGILDADIVRGWLGKTGQADSSAAKSLAPSAGTPAADIETEFKNLVAEKMSKGLKREQAIAVATRQIERDAACGKVDPAAVKQWTQTLAQRKGSPVLGIR